MIEEIINKMPKIELHLHLDGAVSPKIASQISKENENEIASLMQAPLKCQNLSEYLTRFDLPVNLMQTKENLYNISKDLVDRLEKENVIYVEIRFCPMLHTNKGLSCEEVVEAVLSGINSNSNIKANLILCMMRGMPYEFNLEIIKVTEKYLNKGVCALDLAGAEDKFPLNLYVDLFKIAQEKGLPYTIHAGENGDANEVSQAIALGAKRIGHGIHAFESETVLSILKEKNILLEVCPTSNVQTNAVDFYENHPIYKLYNKGVLVSINTDNDTVSNITLTEEYKKLIRTFNFDISDLEKMNEWAILNSFLNNQEKDDLMNTFKNKLKAII